ncbi:hypothetical protein EMCRGX_G014926 [Ephydatia muelleri]
MYPTRSPSQIKGIFEVLVRHDSIVTVKGCTVSVLIFHIDMMVTGSRIDQAMQMIMLGIMEAETVGQRRQEGCRFVHQIT